MREERKAKREKQREKSKERKAKREKQKAKREKQIEKAKREKQRKKNKERKAKREKQFGGSFDRDNFLIVMYCFHSLVYVISSYNPTVRLLFFFLLYYISLFKNLSLLYSLIHFSLTEESLLDNVKKTLFLFP